MADRSLSLQERRAILQEHLSKELAKGARLESQTDYTAVLVYGKKVNHVLHLLLTVLLIGLWLIVWLLLAMTGGERRVLVTVDESGKVSTRKL